jgi:hypothetical protein
MTTRDLCTTSILLMPGHRSALALDEPFQAPRQNLQPPPEQKVPHPASCGAARAHVTHGTAYNIYTYIALRY